MSDFKIGDIVKCIDSEGISLSVDLGSVYKVREVEFDCGSYYLCLITTNGKYIEGSWNSYRFEKVESCKENPRDDKEWMYHYCRHVEFKLLKERFDRLCFEEYELMSLREEELSVGE